MAGGFRVLDAGEAFWRPSNQMEVQNTDLAKQLEIGDARRAALAARAREVVHAPPAFHPDRALRRARGHRPHPRGAEDALTLAPLSAVAVDPEPRARCSTTPTADALWLIAGAPPRGPTRSR